MTGVSFYFFAGDFVDVLQRYDESREQNYQTHDEVARLVHDFVALDVEVDIYSFVTPVADEQRPIDGVRVKRLGAESYLSAGLLEQAVAQDRSEFIVAHYPNPELLRAVAVTDARAMVVAANSYNRRGPRSTFFKRRIVRELNNERFEWVSNHCLPATRHFADIGVDPDKLIAWDVPHPTTPEGNPAKTLPEKQVFDLMYVGSIVEDKGVGDIIRAIAIVRDRGLRVECRFAGLGEIEAMQDLGAELGVSDALHFVGLIGNNQVSLQMSEVDLVVVPSRSQYTEGFPLTMFEAIASRTPIVCSDHPMFRANMIDGVSASVFESGDPSSFADAITRVLRDRALYNALSANADQTWQSLKGPADWRSMFVHWVTDPHPSDWMRAHSLYPNRSS